MGLIGAASHREELLAASSLGGNNDAHRSSSDVDGTVSEPALLYRFE
jgi:hypothetical protein